MPANDRDRMMTPLVIARILFVLTMTMSGFWIGRADARGLEFTGVALLISIFIVALEFGAKVLSGKKILLAGLGAFAGLAFSRLFYDTLPESIFGNSQQASRTVFNLIFMYFGIAMALRNADRISLSRMKFFITSPREDTVLLDTSVIIDGRIRELYEMGFFTKSAIVPNFVVDELQTLADSKDTAKRHQGRRGLENLNNFKEAVPYSFIDRDFPDLKGADSKLIALAKELSVPLLTNDFNLGKVAQLHQVRALNLNSLSAALRPNLTIGDQLIIAISREGKEQHQGVGYLDDGTMVVVDHAKVHIGKTIPITVISMMQTNAGRLAFGRLLEEKESTNPPGLDGAGAGSSREKVAKI